MFLEISVRENIRFSPSSLIQLFISAKRMKMERGVGWKLGRRILDQGLKAEFPPLERHAVAILDVGGPSS